MSDQPPPRPLTEVELSARLHELALAARGAARAPVTGEQVRRRAVRCRRGRRVLLSTSALAAAAVTVVTSGALASPTRQAASPAASLPHPPPAPVQRVTVDLDAYTLTIEGRKFRISGLQDNCPFGETSITVAAKYPSLTMPPNKLTQLSKYVDVRRWAVTFIDRNHHQRLLLNALDPAAGLASIGHDSGPGAIALSPEDGKWVYHAIKPGARVEIKGRQATSADPDSVCYDRQPITGDR